MSKKKIASQVEAESADQVSAQDQVSQTGDEVKISHDICDPAGDSTVVCFTLDRLELARALPVVGADADVLQAVPMAPGSIEAFRTLDGKTMFVVGVKDADGNVSLAALELHDMTPKVPGVKVELSALNSTTQITEGESA